MLAAQLERLERGPALCHGWLGGTEALLEHHGLGRGFEHNAGNLGNSADVDVARRVFHNVAAFIVSLAIFQIFAQRRLRLAFCGGNVVGRIAMIVFVALEGHEALHSLGCIQSGLKIGVRKAVGVLPICLHKRFLFRVERMSRLLLKLCTARQDPAIVNSV